MTFTVKIEGLKEIQTVLRTLPDSTAKAVMRRVLKKNAEPIARIARALAPEHDGELKDSITVSTKLSARQRRQFKKDDRDTVYVYVGAGPLPQAHLQEYGTVHHDAQPFMRPAWDQRKGVILQDIRRYMWDDIKKTIERRRKRGK